MSAAEAHCQSLGGHLASVLSQEERMGEVDTRVEEGWREEVSYREGGPDYTLYGDLH